MKFFSYSLIFLLLLNPVVWAVESSELPWERDIDAVLKAAKEENKMIFMDIYADWCPPCRMLESDTFSKAVVQKKFEDMILIKVNADENVAVASRYGTGSLPTLVVLSPEGMPILTEAGFQTADALVAWIDTADVKLANFRKLEADVKADPGNLEKVVDLSTEYAMLRQSDRALPLLNNIKDTIGQHKDAEFQARYHYLLGVVYFGTDKFDEGASTFAQFLKDFPEDYRAEHAERLMWQGKFMGAQAAMEAEHYDAARSSFQKLAEQTVHADIADEAGQRLKALSLLGNKAPALVVQEWLGANETSLASMKGKVILVDFFQIICPGCKDAKPKIQALRDKYKKDGLEAVGLAVAFELQDSQKPERIREYLDENPYAYPVGIDKEEDTTFRLYNAMGTPWTILIDREGKVRHAAFFREVEIEAKIKKLLAEEA